MSNHAPLITALRPGSFIVTDVDGNEITYSISGGFLEVSNNVATILADSIEKPEEIDIDRANESLERARELLRNRASLEVDTERAEASLERAKNRVRLASKK